MFQKLSQFIGGMFYNSNDSIKNDYDLEILDGCTVGYKLGSIVKDTGYSNIGSALQADKSIRGLFNFRQAVGTQKMLATIDDATSDDTQLFYSTGGNWTEITEAETAWANEATQDVEMEVMDGYCYFVGYSSTDGFLPVASLTNTTFSTSTNVTDMPSAKYIKRYRDRIYIGNCDISGTAYSYRVYYSTVPSSGSITWTVTTNFLAVDYSEWITGLGENWDRLLIFTEYSCYHYNQSEFKKVWDVGCSNHRTIKNSGFYTLWANSDGVWMSSGGRPVNISGKIDAFIKAGTPTSFFAEVVDEEYWLYLGNSSITIDGITYTNCTAVYNIPYKIWRIRQLADTPTIFAKYNSSGKNYLWLGDSSGDIHQKTKHTDSTPVYTDDGSDISSNFKTKKFDFEVPEQVKTINKIMAVTENAQGLLLSGRVIDINQNVLMDWKPLLECKKLINEATVKLKGNFLQIQGREKGSNKFWILDQISVDVDLDTNKK